MDDTLISDFHRAHPTARRPPGGVRRGATSFANVPQLDNPILSLTKLPYSLSSLTAAFNVRQLKTVTTDEVQTS